MKQLRASLTDDAQRAKLDEAAKKLDLAPPRMFPGGLPGGGPGGRAQTPAAPLPPHMVKVEVKVEVKDGVRTITSNGIPDHKPGQFPGRGNPNAISAQSYTFHMPEHPKVNAEPTPHRGLLAGVALNGIVLDPGTAEAWRNYPRTGCRPPLLLQGRRREEPAEGTALELAPQEGRTTRQRVRRHVHAGLRIRRGFRRSRRVRRPHGHDAGVPAGHVLLRDHG